MTYRRQVSVKSRLSDVLTTLEHYLDAAPRTDARTEDHGPLTLFVRDGGGYPYYARPRLGKGAAVTARDVAAVCARQRQLGLPERFEFVNESTPEMLTAARLAGLHITEHPLLVLDTLCAVVAPTGTDVELLTAAATDAEVATAQAVAQLGFSSPGTAMGSVGPDDVSAATAEVSVAEIVATVMRIRSGHTVTAVARQGGSVVGVGCHQPVGAVTEIVGVATLPQARRRGVAAAVTAVLAGDATARGATTVFLCAGDEHVARIYRRIGFRQVATACIGQPS